MPVPVPAFFWFSACLNTAWDNITLACAVSTSVSARTAPRYARATTAATCSLALSESDRAADTPTFDAWNFRIELTSNTLCVTEARASIVKNGPTKVGNSKLGNGKRVRLMPIAAKLAVRFSYEKAPSTSGSNAARASLDRNSACLSDSAES